MVEFITSDGTGVDVVPNQELALTIENAFMANDRMPVAWTTDVELAASPRNCRLFGLPNAMLLPPARRQVNVTMRINGIPVMPGKLKLVSPTATILNVSFQGVEIEASLTGSLREAKLDKWNFGKLGELDDKTLFETVMSGAAEGFREDFATPCMIRSSSEDAEEPYIDLQSTDTREAWATKFVNAKIGTFTIPVVRLGYLLQRVFADCEIDADFAQYVAQIGIVAPCRKNGNLADLNIGCLDKDDDGNYILDLAAAMPDVSTADFVKGVLDAFGATIYITRDGKRMMSNRSILQSSDFIDWTEKISDDFEQEYDDGQNYQYGFSGITNEDVPKDVVECDSVNQAFDYNAGTAVHAKDTDDYYSVFEKSIRLGLSNGESTGYTVKALKVLKQNGMTTEEEDSSLETVSVTSALIPVKTLPYHFPVQISWIMKGTLCAMMPVVEIPNIGESRSTNIYFGILERYAEASANMYVPNIQLTSNGYYGWGGELFSLFGPGTKVSIDTEIGLGKFHLDYKNWMKKKKVITKAFVNLTAADIANLQVWKKRMIQNQLFFIKTITVTLNTSKDYIQTEAELITA